MLTSVPCPFQNRISRYLLKCLPHPSPDSKKSCLFSASLSPKINQKTIVFLILRHQCSNFYGLVSEYFIKENNSRNWEFTVGYHKILYLPKYTFQKLIDFIRTVLDLQKILIKFSYSPPFLQTVSHVINISHCCGTFGLWLTDTKDWRFPMVIILLSLNKINLIWNPVPEHILY